MSILFEDLSFSYFDDGENIVNRFNARFEKDRISVITGNSGEGKSTLLLLGAGIYPSEGGVVRSGKVTAEGRDIGKMLPFERCRTVGIMFQNPDLQFCCDTVRNELIFCLENIDTPISEFETKIGKALEFCEITHLENRQLNTLSGGEKQKAALACLYAMESEWLLLDEPFANIDSESARMLSQKLCTLHEEKGVGILCADHRLDYWEGVCDDVYVYENGQIREKDFLKEESLDVVAPERKIGETALTVENVSVSFGEKQVLKNVCASFKSGEICAITGESGSGKTALLSSICGAVRHKGKVVFRKGRKTVTGIIMQNPQDQFTSDTVKGEILLSLRKDPHKEEKAKKILKDAKLWRYRDVSPYMLSQGQQRRLGAISLCVYKCDVLLCDEPTYAQDKENAAAIMKAICQTAAENGTAVIFTSHDKTLVSAFADRIFEVKDGELHEKTESFG